MSSALISNKVRTYIHSHVARIQQSKSISKSLPSSAASFAADDANNLSLEVAKKLTSWRFCRQRPANFDAFVETIKQRIDKREPIQIIAGHGPLKNMNNCSYSCVDWAEFFTYTYMAQLNAKIREIYQPGMQFTFYLDDSRAMGANNIPRKATETYVDSLKKLVKEADLSHLIKDIVVLGDMYSARNVESHFSEAEALVNKWENDSANQQAMEEHELHAEKNLPDVGQLSEVDRKCHVKEAAHRYRVLYQAEQLAGIWNQPGYLYSRFSSHAGFWQIFTLRKGSVSQPWQGKGCINQIDEETFEPFLLTRNRQHEKAGIARSGKRPRSSGLSKHHFNSKQSGGLEMMETEPQNLWTKRFLLLCASAFLFFTAHHCLYSSLVLYFHQMNFSDLIANQGVIVATFTVASIVGRPLAGAICDGLLPIKRVSVVVLLSGITFSLASLAYVLISDQLSSMLGIRIIHGLAMGFFYTSLTVILAKTIPRGRKAEGMAHFGNAIKFAMFLGPPLGISLASDPKFHSGIFIAAAILGLISVALIIDSLRYVRFTMISAEGRETGSLVERLFSKSSFVPGITMGANSIAFGCLIPFVPLIADQKQILGAAKWYYVVYGATLILSRGLIGKLADRYSKVVTVAPGMIMVALSLLIIAGAESLWVFLIGSGIYGFAAGVVQPALMSLSAELSKPNEIGRAMATFSMLNDLGIALGSFLMGTLSLRIGVTQSMSIMVGLVLAGLGFFLIGERRRKTETVVALANPIQGSS